MTHIEINELKDKILNFLYHKNSVRYCIENLKLQKEFENYSEKVLFACCLQLESEEKLKCSFINAIPHFYYWAY